MSVDPFDIKTVLLVRHAQHVVLIHFPICGFYRRRGVRLLRTLDQQSAAGSGGVFQSAAGTGISAGFSVA